MIITVFTSNQPRHISLIKDLSLIADKVYAIIETNTIFPGEKPDFFNRSDVMKEYFHNIISSERIFFGGSSFLPKNVYPLIVKMGDLNSISMDILKPALQSDEYVVFGSSYIKGKLIDFLVSKKTCNIHMGISPLYRGNSCNFWASYDKNFAFVGASIHLLSKGLDSGPILFHALPCFEANPFDLGMRAVKAAHSGLIHYLSNGQLKYFEAIPQNSEHEIRYSKNIEFDDIVAKEYLNNLPTKFEILDSISTRDTSKFIKPYLY